MLLCKIGAATGLVESNYTVEIQFLRLAPGVNAAGGFYCFPCVVGGCRKGRTVRRNIQHHDFFVTIEQARRIVRETERAIQAFEDRGEE